MNQWRFPGSTITSQNDDNGRKPAITRVSAMGRKPPGCFRCFFAMKQTFALATSQCELFQLDDRQIDV